MNEFPEDKLKLLLNLIDGMIFNLSQDLDVEDYRSGWTDEKSTKWLTWFEELKENVEKGGDFKRGIPSGISRAMDFDGILSGRLMTQASKISNLIRDIYE